MYAGWMRYPDGGGLTAKERGRREKVRLRAVQMFEQDIDPVQVARQLRVSTKSAYQWRRRWRAGGPAPLASRGPGGAACRLDERQLARLRAGLDLGPAAYGWDEDQRWTLARAAALIGRLFHVHYTLRGTSYLLHPIGFSPQVPAHRAAERDEAAIAAWRAGTWAKVRGLAAATGAWICFEDEAGQALRPPRARTWARRGRTPVTTVSGKGSGRVSVAGLICLRPGARGHLFYPMRIHQGRKGERRSLSEAGHAGLITAAHHQLHAPVIVVWDNLNTHVSAVMSALIATRPWLTVYRLPPYAHELNPVEGVWANIKNGLGNLAASSADQLAAVVRNRLKSIQYRPALIDAFRAQTGLTLEPEPP
jgi:transposase